MKEEQMEMFSLPKNVEDITVKDLDRMVENLAKCRQEKANLEALKKEAHQKVTEAEWKVQEALEALDKKSYKCDGVGTVTRVDKLAVTVPKFPETKQQMFDWIMETMGADAYWAYATISSPALNKLYNEKVAEYGERGEVFEMPGVDMPTTRTTLSFRKN